MLVLYVEKFESCKYQVLHTYILNYKPCCGFVVLWLPERSVSVRIINFELFKPEREKLCPKATTTQQ